MNTTPVLGIETLLALNCNSQGFFFLPLNIIVFKMKTGFGGVSKTLHEIDMFNYIHNKKF